MDGQMDLTCNSTLSELESSTSRHGKNYNAFGHIGLLIPENLSSSDNYSHKEVRAAARHANQMKDTDQLISALYGPSSYTTRSNSLQMMRLIIIDKGVL